MSDENPSNPMERMLAEFVNILRFLKENENKPMNTQLSPVMEQRLEKLRKGIEEFKRISKQVIDETGNKRQIDEDARLPPAHLNREERKEWEKMQFIKNELNAIAPKVRENTKKNPELSDLMKSTEKKKIKGRSKRVAKGTGFNKEWKKL